LAAAHGIALICLPGDAEPDLQLAALGTVPLPVADTVFRYCIHGGVDNATAMLRYLSDTLLGTGFGYDPPRSLPEVGVYYRSGQRTAGSEHRKSSPQRKQGVHRPLLALRAQRPLPAAAIVFY